MFWLFRKVIIVPLIVIIGCAPSPRAAIVVPPLNFDFEGVESGSSCYLWNYAYPIGWPEGLRLPEDLYLAEDGLRISEKTTGGTVFVLVGISDMPMESLLTSIQQASLSEVPKRTMYNPADGTISIAEYIMHSRSGKRLTVTLAGGSSTKGLTLFRISVS